MKIETKRKKRMKNCAICFGRCFAFDAGASLHNPTHISNFEWNHKKNPINKIHIFFSAHYFGWLAQHSRFALASITPFHYVYFIAFITTESHRKIHLITRVQQLPHFSSANILDTRRVCGRPKTQILTIENCARKKWKKNNNRINRQKLLHLFYWTHLSLFRSSRSVMFANENYSTQHLNTFGLCEHWNSENRHRNWKTPIL